MKGADYSSAKKLGGHSGQEHLINEIMFCLSQTNYSQKSQTLVRVEDFSRQQGNRLTQLLNYLQHFLGMIFEGMQGEVLTMDRLQNIMRHWQLVPAHLSPSQLKSVDSSQSSWNAALKVLHQMGQLAIQSQLYQNTYLEHDIIMLPGIVLRSVSGEADCLLTLVIIT